jgi:hypothetical protein
MAEIVTVFSAEAVSSHVSAAPPLYVPDIQDGRQ